MGDGGLGLDPATAKLEEEDECTKEELMALDNGASGARPPPPPPPLYSPTTPRRSRTRTTKTLSVTPSNNPWLSAELESPLLGVVELDKISWPREPSKISPDLVRRLVEAFESCGSDPTRLRRLLTFSNLSRLLKQAEKLFQTLPNVVPIVLQEDISLTVLGDTHGQFFDLLKIFKLNGFPSPQNWYLVNGDFVDRGCWGLETAVTLLAFKLLYPNAVRIIRGNHETLYCTQVYGFLEECKYKYSKAIHEKFHNVFARLPLASVIFPVGGSPDRLQKLGREQSDLRVGDGEGVLVLHGGLFRNIDGSLGTLGNLQTVKRYIKDPEDEPLLDALWSDPKEGPGLENNHLRGCATLFGPDITWEFLSSHGLSLMIRSHEGPDARAKRPYMSNDMMGGFAIDQFHCGNPLLITVFSAPDYPQGPASHKNLGAFIKFHGSLKPEFEQFSAAPRPWVRMYYAGSNNFTDMEED